MSAGLIDLLRYFRESGLKDLADLTADAIMALRLKDYSRFNDTMRRLEAELRRRGLHSALEVSRKIRETYRQGMLRY